MSSLPSAAAQYGPRSGCPLCSIVATPFPRSDLLGGDEINLGRSSPISIDPSYNASSSSLPLASSSSTTNIVIYKDANVTAYIEKKYPVSSKGHIIIVLNLHVPSIYTLSSTDIPLLTHIQTLATRLLHSLNTPPTPSSPTGHGPDDQANRMPLAASDMPFHIGFITPPFRDNKIPITDHLHAHAYVGTTDLAGWWRALSYSGLAWYSVQDLIGEIRESTSNNRIKTGYSGKPSRPIDTVPGAGAIAGGADGGEEQVLPLPLQVNKVHLSPAPRVMSVPPTSTSTSVSTLHHPQFEHTVTGSVDLGTGFQGLRGGASLRKDRFKESVVMTDSEWEEVPHGLDTEHGGDAGGDGGGPRFASRSPVAGGH